MNMKVGLVVVCLQLLVLNINASQIKNEHPEPRYVPKGYKQYRNSGFYKFHSNATNWYIARQTCENEGAHLIILNDEEEASIMGALMELYKPYHMFIHAGFNDLVTEGQYMTIYGQPLESTGFMKWSPGEPNNEYNLDNCGSLQIENDVVGLNDSQCGANYMFVCELKD